jgi:hypothetical protein
VTARCGRRLDGKAQIGRLAVECCVVGDEVGCDLV